MKIDDRFHGITTLLAVNTTHSQIQGTGFYYMHLGLKNGDKSQWREAKNQWLVTNRHVVLPKVNNNEIIPDSFSFHLRKIDGNTIKWEPLILNRDELIKRTKLHPDPKVDVCIIDVLDLLKEKIKSGTYARWDAVSKENFPGNNNIEVEVSDDAVVIGYPRGFYDKINLFPIVKSGIIASRWGAYFNGKPYFLIDAKLFPGSSGSIVVSKPQNIAIKNGNLMYAKEKQFSFLGIYSGEPFIEFDDITITRKFGFNVGIVWYGHLIEDIIKKETKISL